MIMGTLAPVSTMNPGFLQVLSNHHKIFHVGSICRVMLAKMDRRALMGSSSCRITDCGGCGRGLPPRPIFGFPKIGRSTRRKLSNHPQRRRRRDSRNEPVWIIRSTQRRRRSSASMERDPSIMLEGSGIWVREKLARVPSTVSLEKAKPTEVMDSLGRSAEERTSV